MPKYLLALLLFNSFSFLFFGISCLYTPFMKLEFRRYGLEKYRVIVGVFQVLGAVAIGLGFWIPKLFFAGCLGLAILMFMGFMVRLKIKDSFVKSFPAFFYWVFNMVLAFLVWKN